ncbi:MAG: hypothetical protein R3Y11_04565 [Pseudomonadota bacterium]
MREGRKDFCTSISLAVLLTVSVLLGCASFAQATIATLYGVVIQLQNEEYEQAYNDATSLYQGNFANVEAKFLLAIAA